MGRMLFSRVAPLPQTAPSGTPFTELGALLMSLTVLSPVGINRVEARPISPRIKSLEGATLGILINNKPNSEFLQDQIAELLKQKYKIAKVVKKVKPNASVGAKGLELFAKEVGAAITAIGD
jgi:hypothetical protein